MAAARDLTGERFGRLVAETLLYRKSRRYWVCRCDCGRTTRPVQQCDLIDGSTRSCGCLLAEAAAAKGAPRSNFVDSPYNTSGPWSTAQGGGKSWMGQGNMPLSVAAPARAVVANPMDLPPNNMAP